jgi:hypothetical protein
MFAGQSKSTGRPVAAEALFAAGIGSITVGIALLAAVISALRAGQPYTGVMELLAMTGFAGIVIGILLLSEASTICRVDQIKRMMQTSTERFDEDVIPLHRERI